MRAAVLCLINRQRTSRGLPTLHASRRLNRSAQGWTEHIVATVLRRSQAAASAKPSGSGKGVSRRYHSASSAA
jgi:hypothetical protein